MHNYNHPQLIHRLILLAWEPTNQKFSVTDSNSLVVGYKAFYHKDILLS